MAITTPDYIADDLVPLAVPIDNLTPLPGNYRRHDIEKIKAALKRYKQRKSITVQRASIDANGFGVGTITAGNGTWQAAKELGWTHIAATFYDDTDEEALGWALTDNRTHDLGSDDQRLLNEALQRIQHDGELLTDIGFNSESLLALANSVTPKRPEVGDDEGEEGQEGGGNPQRAPGNPVVQYQIIFENDDQQQVWFKFIRYLKRNIDGETVAGRLTNFLDNILDGYDE